MTGDSSFFETHWCCDRGAFVRGGMVFNNKKLYVPKCGYYHVSSQVEFIPAERNIERLTEEFVHHQILVDSNCPGEQDMYINAYGVNKGGLEWKSTTHASRLFRICSGGSVEIRTPNEPYSTCCPTATNTFFFVQLVQEEIDCSQ